MCDIALRNVDDADFGAVVALNTAEVMHTSPMDEARLRHLDRLSAYHKVVTVDG